MGAAQDCAAHAQPRTRLALAQACATSWRETQPRRAMRVAVTGVAGLIGGVVHDRLLERGHELIGIDLPHDAWLSASRNTDDERAPARVTNHFDLASVADAELTEVLAGVDVLVHLAADANPSNPDESIRSNNFIASERVMRCAASAGIRRAVLASSGLVQIGLEDRLEPGGDLEGELIGVEHGVAPTSFYGESKVHVEMLGEEYAAGRGMECIAVRIGTVVPNESEHWERGGRLQATAFLQADVANFYERTVEADLGDWKPSSCRGHPQIDGYLITAAQSDSPGRFVDLEPGISALGWRPGPWPEHAP
jgi:NAD(P)-dependent dehydrogenase (short-subunit alcohol dehydrogenase family)